MTLLLLVACTKNPPPFDTPLGPAVPSDYLSVEVVDLDEGTPLPSAGGLRLGDAAYRLDGVVGGDEPDLDAYDVVAGYAGSVLGVLGPVADMDTWVEDAATVVNGVTEVDAWEIWSAPDLDGTDPGELAGLACELAASVDKARLVAPAVSGPDGDAAAWLQDFVDAGGGACVGSFAVQADGAGSPESLPDLLAALRDQLKGAGLVSRAIWNVGETLEPGSADPAGYVARWALLQWPVGVDRAFVHSWGGQSIALVSDGSPTEAGTALSVLDGWIVGRDLSGCVAEDTVWTCTIRSEAGRSLIVWDETGSGEIGVPEDVSTVRYLDGSSAAASGSVPLTDVPVLLDGGA